MTERYVQLHQDRITTTSLVVAEIFGKEHKNVLQSIEKLDCSKEFTELNFQPSEYKGKNGMNKFYFITRDGFSFLAMGYTGPAAAKFKEAFIKAFNRMEQALKVATTPAMLPVYEKRIMSEPTKSCPDNRWCVFDQSHSVMLFVTREVGSINQYDLVDGSIGAHWVKHREGKKWAKPVTQYWHEFEDKRGKQLSNCYDYTELEHFKVWLKGVYMKVHLYNYLFGKFKKDKTMLDRVKAVEPKLIGKKKS